MAFGKTKESTEGASFKKYTGIASGFVRCVNPTKEELEKFYGREIEKEPSYIKREEDNNGVVQIRIDFMFEANPASDLHPNIEFKDKVSIYLNRKFRLNREGTKYQVIDHYGNTAWVTEEEFNVKAIPVDKNNNPIRIAPNYRKAYEGEEEIVKFLIAYLGIDSCFDYDKNTNKYVWKPQDKLADTEAYLSEIDKYFDGNIQELREAIGLQPNNKVKVLFGVKHTSDGDYQNTFNRMFLKNGNTNYTKLAEEVEKAQSGGAYPSTEFEVSPLHELVVDATDFTSTPSEASPADSPWGK